jgi:hypothetical protein
MQEINRRLTIDTGELIKKKEDDDKRIEEESKKIKHVRDKNLSVRKDFKF